MFGEARAEFEIIGDFSEDLHPLWSLFNIFDMFFGNIFLRGIDIIGLLFSDTYKWLFHM